MNSGETYGNTLTTLRYILRKTDYSILLALKIDGCNMKYSSLYPIIKAGL